MSSLERLQKMIWENVSEDFHKKKVCLACEEAFTNIVNYAKATAIEVRIEVVKNNLVIAFADDGVQFNPLDEQTAQKNFDDFENGGMGIGLIKNLADTCYVYANHHNVLMLTFSRAKNT
jgi:anti-sigma regulatory factor (Ser/Thr protein kinase)